ncbi:alpha/beta hydrolase [Sansalvadorimonas verongulae]|uniref:alpha/beta hydrolase n=1 Tax=Sansalvadorimonas verongulae TaxID=2172824 RepID=UPI0018AD0FF7|nr:alpha/beta fold hydrolase [Sansalvadorimonas verongulae]
MKKFLIAVVFPLLILSGCQSHSTHPFYTPSGVSYSKAYTTFDEYVQQSRKMLAEHRYFLTSHHADEIDANAPFEVQPEHSKDVTKGVLLIHGLGDSPFSFVDIAQSLAHEGFLVRTVLLPGHGTRPADMVDVDYREWKQLVEQQVALLKKDVDDVYLGGFSTGGNLAYAYSVDDPDIKGLMLFAPGFKSNEPLAFMTPALSRVKNWVTSRDPGNFTNYARYSDMPVNGFAQYYKTSRMAMHQLNQATFDRPVFMVLTEHDSVLETAWIKEMFKTRFTHPNNHLIWYGSAKSSIDGQIRTIQSYMPEWRIRNMSHMGILFSPNNPYYGVNGTERLCRNQEEASEADRAACRAGKPVWYSAWGSHEGKGFHARLTFNPAYDVMIKDLLETFPSKDRES